ncbi:MAG: GGDEF domain-containing protein, partial [Oscillospiraceae bacterium]
LCSCIAMMLWPVPLLLFITETHSFHNKKPFNILAGLFLTNFVVLMMLQIFNIVDLIESIFVTILLLIICIVFFVFDILVEIIKYKNRDIYLLGLGTSVFISLSLIDLVRYYSKIGADNSMFSRFGVLFYILILGYYAVKQLMNMMSQNIDTRMLEKLAFSDRLTGLQNRTAFETDMEPYRTDVACCEGLWIGIFDINNLKLVNDTQGHKMGDNAILTAVDCLKTAFNSRGRLYRIGGDEFALITENLTSGEAEELLKRFEKELESSRQEKCQTLSVAYGIAEFDPAADKTVDELYVRADSYMYHEKYKAKRYSIRSD